MSTLEIVLTITQTLSGIGLIKSWRDNRSLDVQYWKETIEHQNKTIAELRANQDALTAQLELTRKELHRANERIMQLESAVPANSRSARRAKRVSNLAIDEDGY